MVVAFELGNMMWCKKVIKILRKRFILIIIFLVSLGYCIVSVLRQGPASDVTDVEAQQVRVPSKTFQWHTTGDRSNASGSKSSACRNSVQGKALIADDRGYVCQRRDVLSDGCCDAKAASTKWFSCETCRENGCCSIYEYCISCCLQPDKKVLLQKILGKASETFNVLFASITDHFELCLTKCRTSSQSVQHENSYRDPKAKHCYGEFPPVVQPAPS